MYGNVVTLVPFPQVPSLHGSIKTEQQAAKLPMYLKQELGGIHE